LNLLIFISKISSAKPLYPGSNPGAASNKFNGLAESVNPFCSSFAEDAQKE
jgi:hypothetical protein